MSVHVIAVDFTEAPSRTDRELVACRQEGAQRPYACLIKRARSVHILDGSTTTTITTSNAQQQTTLKTQVLMIVSAKR